MLTDEVRTSLLDETRLAVLREIVLSVADLPGDLAELGVYRGGSALAIYRAAPGRRLHLFDTFTGLPAPDPALEELAEGRFAASVLEVLRLLEGAPITVHVGRFPDSVAGMRLPLLAFVHVDGDLYWTTRHAIEVFWPILVPGGAIVFDDYHNAECPGVALALRESGLAFRVLGTGQAVLPKPRDLAAGAAYS